MYIYDIGYYSHEESDNVQFYHEQKFSKKEFEDARKQSFRHPGIEDSVNIVIKAAINMLKNQKIGKRGIITFQDIFHDVAEELTRNFGFRRVDFTARFNAFGWANILDKKDWEDDRDEQLNLLTEKLMESK